MTFNIDLSTAGFRHLVFIQNELKRLTGEMPTTEDVLELLLERTACQIFTANEARKGGSVDPNNPKRERSAPKPYPVSSGAIA